jgi:hypothetical protein
MTNDTRDLFTVLRKELEFLEKGSYRSTARTPWRPKFVFQDSPTCLNSDPALVPRPCTECALMQLVPEDMNGGNFPAVTFPSTNGERQSILSTGLERKKNWNRN